MGYCGLKIPGHSETDFKHRTAFASRKKVLDINTAKVGIIHTSKVYIYDSKKQNRLKVLIIILTALILGSTYYLGKSIFIAGIKPHLSALQSPKESESIEFREAAKLMYDSAKSYYYSGFLNDAQEEMVGQLIFLGSINKKRKKLPYFVQWE